MVDIKPESPIWFSFSKRGDEVEGTMFVYAGEKEIQFETVAKKSFSEAMRGLDEKLNERYRKTKS